jgi:ABC-type glutathione transport system ATPase component
MAYFVILASDEREVCLVIKVVEASLGWLKEEEEPPSDALKANEEKLRTKMPIGSREYEMVPTKAKGVAVGESENSDRSISSLLPIDDKEESPVNRSVHTLDNFNVIVRKGQFIAVVGAVGSGKIIAIKVCS